MKRLFKFLKKFTSYLFNTRAAGLYILLFAAAIAIATFVENDFGTSAAQKVIFKSWWFELLLILFGISILVNIFKFRMIQQKKWPLVIFHAAIIIILIGAGVTRYFGYEGIMHIRENNSSNNFLSSNTYLKFRVTKNNQTYNFDEDVLFASLGNNYFKESYIVDNDLIEVEVKDFIPNPKQVLQASIDGKPTLKIVVSGMNGREEYFISEGESKRINNILYNFNDQEVPNAFNILFKGDSLSFKTNTTYSQMVMATQTRDTIYPSGSYQSLKLRALYSNGINNVVFPEFNPKGVAKMESESTKVKNESITALVLDVTVNGDTQETIVYGAKGNPGRPQLLNFNDLNLAISYGSKDIYLPFYIKLNKFILDKYPGTQSASSYASEVTLMDSNNSVNMDFRIFMNNILNYGGYRFFQSSFDKDEKGTYLSVNHDFWGTTISYLGYILLTAGMIWTLFSKKTRFHQVIKKIKKIRASSSTFMFVLGFLMTSQLVQSQNQISHITHSAVSAEHAEAFSKLVVQDYKGRMKPVHTLSREIMRKIYRKESYKGLNADQILLSIFVNSQDWYGEKIIKLGKHQDLLNKIGVTGSYASYQDFFDTNGNYKLRDEVSRVYDLIPKDRGVYEKELLKVDERLNILNMMFSGGMLKIIPVTNDENNTWISNHSHGNGHDSQIASDFFSSYTMALKKGIDTKNYGDANRLLAELKDYQFKNGGEIMPSAAKINAEILLNKLNIFNRLALLYFLLGIAFLFFLFLSVFKPRIKLKTIYKVLFALVITGFVFHTLGLGLRWYISGRAPWSNGYESMIYIAWTTTLAGILFTRKSFGGLAATMVLAATILLVSMLSFLDPEITPLVPVLKSYWLTIHVSLEAGSYGFLMLGAIIGLINLSLMIFTTAKNKERVKTIITEMSYISELTITGGLIMVSIGTYLGGVWANESWGRYWGWDAKETWALVTILVYAFILHMRIIPKLTGLFVYNVSTIFGLATVIMTYYGVNYYLSGLHSYATGDPIPIPSWVYIVVACIIAITALAYLKKRKYKVIS
ncbi:cytochrome c biogenesis protein [Yeosuana marina]|uniref:cytochrome c biogenesis protein n=1 Tax=Yeosuana marina TaxID=1565536 RepID=UPI0030EE86F8|tara:strand:+ start:1958 stop:5071 length:3114 start_codon:yes stop_codon:yes gene_type:complete